MRARAWMWGYVRCRTAMMVPSSVHAVTSSSTGQVSLSMTKLWYRAAANGLSMPCSKGLSLGSVHGPSIKLKYVFWFWLKLALQHPICQLGVQSVLLQWPTGSFAFTKQCTC